MNKRYYKLEPQCYLISGKTGILLLNVYEKRIIPITNPNVKDALVRAEVNEQVDVSIPELKELVKMGWAAEYDKPVYIEKIRVSNEYSKRHMWKSAPVIDVATLQIAGDCDKDCSDCHTSRCATCKKVDNNEPLSVKEWKTVIDKLAFYNTKTLIFTGGNPFLNPDWEKLYDYAAERIPVVFLHVVGLDACGLAGPNRNIMLSILEKENPLKLTATLNKYKNIAKVMISEKLIGELKVKDSRVSVVNTSNVQIHKTNMYSKKADIYRYTLKRMYNECFFGRIVVDADGNILPCIGAIGKLTLGNVKTDAFEDSMVKLITGFWNNSIDDMGEESACGACENRYVCRTRCLFAESVGQCDYNVEEAKWN